MKKLSPQAGIGTLVTHLGEFENPNARHLARKIAALEGLDLLRGQPDLEADAVVAAEMFTSGMAAVSAGLLACLCAAPFDKLRATPTRRIGDTVIVQDSLYSGTFVFLNELAPRLGIHVVWVHDYSPAGWDEAFAAHPEARLAYAETPANPMMDIVDLAAVAEVAHRYGAWLMVDNTFATPYCQRPLSLGADVVIHSTTKYLCGHGTIIGGALVSSHNEQFWRDAVF